MKTDVRFRIRVDTDHQPAIGPGKIALLEAIIATGSISAAARKLGMSYMRAWLLIEDLNRRLCMPAVNRVKGGKQGGSTEVTPTGRQLVKLYRDIEAAAYSKSLPKIRALKKLLAK
jgi:molybdate transport system regulatory protein